MSHRFDIPHFHRRFSVLITDDGGLELWLDGCLRKRREPSDRDPLYVWTNIELDWEEHHYVEARYFRRGGESKERGEGGKRDGSGEGGEGEKLLVTVNGAPILEQSLAPPSG